MGCVVAWDWGLWRVGLACVGLVLVRLVLIWVVVVVAVAVEVVGQLVLSAHLHEEAVLDAWGWRKVGEPLLAQTLA